ncbi:MAG: DUF2397 family protein [Proteobacteria bacterium]|nr:DUF2397 family protein [Pseudomonadota bacterium]MBU1060083.1 DUF2397 family protein [Pseudomonadota bacterium]
MTSSSTDQPITLFSDQPLSAFDQGMAAELIKRRNPNLGSLLITERAPFYVTILYRMLLFKRDHELEPLYDDIYQAVFHPLEGLEQTEYSPDRFRTDLDQLANWNLVSSRIEKQRLRGYRDNRKRKFRYRLSDEAASLLHWLEQRLQDELEERSNDARDLLGEVRGALGELLRLLHGLRLNAEGQEDSARRIIFQLGKADDLCQSTTEGLIDLNGRLMAFLLRRYEADEVRIILGELDNYVQVFLKQAFGLRREIVPLLHRLQKRSIQDKLHFAFTAMEKERRLAPHLLQVRREASGLAIPDRLNRFFEDQGGLDHLLQRINESSLQVWQKLRSHLQELERKNHRLQDLRHRIEEIASLDESVVPLHFMEKLCSCGQGFFDRNYWDSREKADPPQPSRRISRKEKIIRAYIKPKKKSDGPVQSMDEARLASLEKWLQEKVLSPPANGQVEKGDFGEFADFPRIMELARAGLLGEGKRLASIALLLQAAEERAKLDFASCQLDLPKLTVKAN